MSFSDFRLGDPSVASGICPAQYERGPHTDDQSAERIRQDHFTTLTFLAPVIATGVFAGILCGKAFLPLARRSLPPAMEPFERFGRIVTEMWHAATDEALWDIFSSGFFPRQGPKRVAELAAGTGRLTSQLAQRYPKTRILAHDRQSFPLWLCNDPIPTNITHWPETSFEDLATRLRAGRQLHTFDRVYCILPETLPKHETGYAKAALEMVAPNGEIHMILDDHEFAHEVEAILRSGNLVVQTAEVPTLLRSQSSAIVERNFFGLLDPNVPLVWVAAKARAPRRWNLPPLPRGEDLVIPTTIMEEGRLITSRAKGPLSAADSLVIDMEMLCWGRPMSDRLLWGGLRVDMAGYRVDHVDLSRMADGARRFYGRFVTDSGSVVGEFEYVVPPPPGIDRLWLARQQRMQLAPDHRGRGIEQSFLRSWSRFLHHLGVDGIRVNDKTLSITSPVT